MKKKLSNIDTISAGIAQLLPVGELVNRLAKKKFLRVKLGMDPTAPNLHLGHAVVLSKIKQLQDLGHDIVIIIGDFTARIGDPTGKSKTRPSLTKEEIKRNAQTYFEQIGKILDASKLTVRYNSEWLDKLTAADIIKLCASVTLARLIERDDFSKRLKKDQSISFHELLYPIFQGYDSIAIESDIELGGTDQTFNLLMGRHLQAQYGQEPQLVLTMPLLEGLDGSEKMSKSLNNAIGLTEAAGQAYGKLMSISDTLMWRYFSLLCGKTASEISQLQERIAYGSLHPMNLKKNMAHEIIDKFWSKKEADTAEKQFEQLFQKRDYSYATTVQLPNVLHTKIWVVDLCKKLGAITTSSEAKRLIESGAIEVDGKKVIDFKAEVMCVPDITIKIGKHRFYKIVK